MEHSKDVVMRVHQFVSLGLQGDREGYSREHTRQVDSFLWALGDLPPNTPVRLVINKIGPICQACPRRDLTSTQAFYELLKQGIPPRHIPCEDEVVTKLDQRLIPVLEQAFAKSSGQHTIRDLWERRVWELNRRMFERAIDANSLFD